MSTDERDQRQAAIAAWARAAFGAAEATSLPQRGLRLLEEATEAAQACGVDSVQAVALVRYVFARPVGDLGQELGGVGVTTLALAAAAGLSAEYEEWCEVARVLGKPLEHFAKRNAEKNAAGFLAATSHPVTDYNPTEAQRLIAEAREDRHGWNAIAKIKALADQLEAAGREVESQWRRNDEIRASLASTTAERDALRAELSSVREVADPDHDTPELSLRERVMHIGGQAALLVSVTRMAKERGEERDSLRQQLECACRERDEAMRVSVELGKHADAIADMRVAHEMDGLKYALAAAQRRIAELEMDNGALTALRDDLASQIAAAWQATGASTVRRLVDLTEVITDQRKTRDDARAALRAILPVYRAAEECERLGWDTVRGSRLFIRVRTARSAITPEIAAVMAAMEDK